MPNPQAEIKDGQLYFGINFPHFDPFRRRFNIAASGKIGIRRQVKPSNISDSLNGSFRVEYLLGMGLVSSDIHFGFNCDDNLEINFVKCHLGLT